MKTLNRLKFDVQKSFILYDKKLIQFKAFASWIRQFPYSIGLSAGESLKTLDSYSSVLDQIQKIATAANHVHGAKLRLDRHFQFIAVGGGSLTDFAGFVAATYQRGHPWIAVPSTWLCAVDSAHGGKNGLNLNGVKNQIGTIHFPQDVIFCDELLKIQPAERLLDSAGEILKITLLGDKKGFDQFKLDERFVLKNLKIYAGLKNAIVKKDPFEKKKIRYLLNFGHTVGHVFEAEKSLPHGISILFGMIFAIHFSVDQKVMNKTEAALILHKIRSSVFNPNLEKQLKYTFEISSKSLIEKLVQDKKTQGSKVHFIFLKKRGQGIVKAIAVEQIVKAFDQLKMKESFFDV